MSDYLLEIGTEELPADYVTEAQERLKALMSEQLGQNNLQFSDIKTYGTPRRIACIVSGLLDKQKTVHKRVKGPPVKSSLDAAGKPLPAAMGFAQKQGLGFEQLGREEIGGIEYLVADLTIEGKPTARIIADLVPAVVSRLSGERLMRWGDRDIRFSRPIRWLVSLLDNQAVPVAIDDIPCGTVSFGNRVLANEKVTIGSPGDYVNTLRTVRVLVDPQERRQLIEQQVTAAASKVGGQARRLKGGLLDEVVNILEWPSPVVGQFAEEYLELPDHLIETVMVHHQRYFPVEATKNGAKLLPYFVAVSNNDRQEAEPQIKQGNERVLRARLADGRFFYLDDQKTKLSERKEALNQLTFQEGLGSYLKKSERLMKLSRQLSSMLNLDSKHSVCLERVAELGKLDLVTSLVRELPELQGYVGSWYAEKDGEPAEVTCAIASHYAPRSTEDTLPADTIGKFASVIDKLDTLVGLFALGRRPSGSGDPYGLRRQAQGLIDILVDGLPEYAVNLKELALAVMADIKPMLQGRKSFDEQKALFDLFDFFTQRLKIKLLDSSYSKEIIEAALGIGEPFANISDVLARCAALKAVIAEDYGAGLIKAGVRVGNILKTPVNQAVNQELFEHEAERQLFDKFEQEIEARFQAYLQDERPGVKTEYIHVMEALSTQAPVIDEFFAAVLVNDPDDSKRLNRHALLTRINRYFSLVADFTKLQPLIV